MRQDRRYQLQHLGDTFVDAVSSVATSARQHAKNVVLTYDLRALQKKKTQCLSLIGGRIVQVRRAGLADLTRDDVLVEMIDDVGQIDRAIASFAEKKRMTMGGCGHEATCCRANECRSQEPGQAAVRCDPS